MGSKSRSRKSNSKKRKFHGHRHTKFIDAQCQRQGATAYSPVQDHEERGDTQKVTPGPCPTASTSNSLETPSVTARTSASSEKLKLSDFTKAADTPVSCHHNVNSGDQGQVVNGDRPRQSHRPGPSSFKSGGIEHDFYFFMDAELFIDLIKEISKCPECYGIIKTQYDNKQMSGLCHKFTLKCEDL